ncbi:NAD-glutamate dehydrogenase [Streptomyces sp. SID11385]|uniref:NAD-glutamate dehydrogenase n=1 Tax=Streptomyces sp. SID11385 TaxID=2706031 RepID=UPI0013CA6802|nr:NAD-glutamate dehydrogenase [Streptomyces sp. SID11385]NEA39275.1 NAD-glutamate dehydrogenase [Streptomyces sp. SID11385]
MATAPIPAAEPRTFWALYEDGSAGRISVVTAEDAPPVLAKPGRVVTEEEHTAYVAELATRRDTHLAEERSRAQARCQEDYEALRAAGVPEATARRLSGHEGDTSS